jgi:hypothetical protein
VFFGAESVKYLGYMIDKKGYKVDPSRVQALKDFPAPTNIKELRRFLGIVQTYNQHVVHIYDKAINLRKLTRKDVPYTWTSVHQKEFDELKDIIANNVELGWFDPSKPTLVRVDASDGGCGGCLFQKNSDGTKTYIVILNRIFSDVAQRWSTIE